MFRQFWAYARQHIGSSSGTSDNSAPQPALRTEHTAVMSIAERAVCNKTEETQWAAGTTPPVETDEERPGSSDASLLSTFYRSVVKGTAMLPTVVTENIRQASVNGWQFSASTVATQELVSAMHASTASSFANLPIPWWSDVPKLQPVYIQPLSCSGGALADTTVAPFGATSDVCSPTVVRPVLPHPVPVPIMGLDAIHASRLSDDQINSSAMVGLTDFSALNSAADHRVTWRCNNGDSSECGDSDDHSEALGHRLTQPTAVANSIPTLSVDSRDFEEKMKSVPEITISERLQPQFLRIQPLAAQRQNDADYAPFDIAQASNTVLHSSECRSCSRRDFKLDAFAVTVDGFSLSSCHKTCTSCRDPCDTKLTVSSSETAQSDYAPTDHILPLGLVTPCVPAFNDTTSCAVASKVPIHCHASASARNSIKGHTASDVIGSFATSEVNTPTLGCEWPLTQQVANIMPTEQSLPEAGYRNSRVADVSPVKCGTAPAAPAFPADDTIGTEDRGTCAEMIGRQDQQRCDHVVIRMEEDTVASAQPFNVETMHCAPLVDGKCFETLL